MTWLTIYGSIAVAVLGILTICFARDLRVDALRLLAIAAAAALWPVMALGLVQYGAIQLLAWFLGRHSATPAPPAVAAEPATTPTHLVDSMARLAQQISATRHA